MDGLAFLSSLMGGARVGGAYYFCGEDPYSLHKGVRAIADRTNPDLRDMNAQVLKSPAPSDVINAAETLPFFDELRVVVVQEFDADTANALADYAPRVPETTVLLFVRPGKAPVSNPLYKAVLALDRAVSFNLLAPDQAQSFLQKRAKENAILLDSAAANLLVQYLGSDLGALENTLLMLGAYVGSGGRVTIQAVQTCVKPSSEYKVFSILDQLWAGNKKNGIRDLTALVEDPSESAMGLATLFERNVRTVVSAKQLMMGGRSEAQITGELGVAPFVAQKAARNAKKRSLEQLNGALKAFASIEWQQKQGIAKAEEALIMVCYENF